MEPDYFITESGVPDILLRRNKIHDKRLTDVKKFQHKHKERCKRDLRVVEVVIESPMSAKSMKNLQNERLKSGLEERKRMSYEANLERMR